MAPNRQKTAIKGKLDELAEGQTSFEAFRHLGLCSLDIINQSVFSYCTDCQLQGENNPYVHAVQRLSDLWIKRSLYASEGNEDEETSGLDFLDIILKAKDDDGRGLTPLEVRDEVDTFLFEGSHVAIDIYNIHHNASMWGEDYDNFRPSRFEGDAARDMDPFAFVPFSAGPRNCIGQNFAMNEMKVVISRLLHRTVHTKF
ncbi:CP4F5-like protein [Mya arenaria]|uniref:CP4F5-like protein n=1 Tax=Mya arenaria TaxID=6604 RepID=A0ABY7EYB9_MYAAR|nr:CP4F5-like protein [Mya arenaria]